MKLLKAEVSNFGSYQHLEFDFSNLGLALVHGATGSGKSTLQDVVPWLLFGVTAKDGNADEIRSWTNPDEPTKGVIVVETSMGTITVHRVRGTSSQNDLYWLDQYSGETGTVFRGKDLTETQKLLEQRLVVSKDLYIAGAYYNEFSPTGTFFTAKAKDRRELFEKLADLDLAKTLQEKTSDARKDAKKDLQAKNSTFSSLTGRAESLRSSLKDSNTRRSKWDADKERHLEVLQSKLQGFEDEKESKIHILEARLITFENDKNRKIEALVQNATLLQQQLIDNPSDMCNECGQPNEKTMRDRHRLSDMKIALQHQTNQVNPHTLQLEQAKTYENPYNEQIEAEKAKANPFVSQIHTINCDIVDVDKDIKDLSFQIHALEHKIASLTHLADLSADLRGVLLNRSIKEIETSTNRYLEKYFDSELRVGFELESDDLNISLTNNGYAGVYKQMSKGERGLLKLCFSISVMKAAANRAGVHFGLLCFDEGLEGLDSNLKVKAFRLFQELELDHESLLVVEHSTEFKALFSKSFLVTMDNDISTIEEL